MGSLGSVLFVVYLCFVWVLVVCLVDVQSSLLFPSGRVSLCAPCGRDDGVVVWFGVCLLNVLFRDLYCEIYSFWFFLFLWRDLP